MVFNQVGSVVSSCTGLTDAGDNTLADARTEELATNPFAEFVSSR
jgi:hypothetical protein